MTCCLGFYSNDCDQNVLDFPEVIIIPAQIWGAPRAWLVIGRQGCLSAPGRAFSRAAPVLESGVPVLVESGVPRAT
jgi:hypothetical protein